MRTQSSSFMVMVMVVVMVMVLGTVGAFTVDRDFMEIFGAKVNFDRQKFYEDIYRDDYLSDLVKNKRVRDSPLVPVVIVPSLIGSQLEIKLVNAQVDHWWCFQNSDFFTIWIDTNYLVPFEVECFADYIRLVYNFNNNTVVSPKGMTMRPKDDSNMTGVLYIDVQKKMPIWAGFVEVFTKLGYEIGKNLRASPYDWRLGPDSQFGGTFQQLQQIVEETYAASGNQSVSLISLSMGGGYLVQFLNTVSQPWKDKYIHSFIPLSSCFGGSIWSAVTLLGAKYPGIDADISSLLSAWPSIPWIGPYPSTYQDQVIFSTPSKKFTAADLAGLYAATGKTDTAEILNLLVSPYQTLPPPGVPTYCIYGSEVPIPGSIHFLTEDLYFGGNTTNTTTTGDGTCSHESLELCEIWAAQQTQPSVPYPIQGMVHGDALGRADVLRIILKLLNL